MSIEKFLKENIQEQELIPSLANYLKLLQQWNRVHNLTAITDPEQMVILHILDSLAISPYLYGQRLLDVGTGAGLPGIPLAIKHPEKEFTLLDSNSKKTRFLTQVKHELQIKNINIIHSRVEDFHPDKNFDSILSRAFSSLEVMLQTTQHLLAAGGQFLAMKGIYPEEELKAIPETFKVTAVHTLTIQGLDAKRCLVCIERS
ncbi:hypothetical protein AYO45_04250 [Gammaproteobacteria bacterium SCGC AG-212-F23]|nr:hypothetical protein AYO45_04250 [Gammaproteobacteria bacterium SCGC AG-212-F23]